MDHKNTFNYSHDKINHWIHRYRYELFNLIIFEQWLDELGLDELFNLL